MINNYNTYCDSAMYDLIRCLCKVNEILDKAVVSSEERDQ